MIGTWRRFLTLVATVSAFIALAIASLISGIGQGRALATTVGAITGTAGVLGLIVLGRVVFVLEQRKAAR